MANSLQDNVLTYFENPDPLNQTWLSKAVAGILRHGIDQHSFQDQSIRDFARGIVDNLKLLEQVCTNFSRESGLEDKNILSNVELIKAVSRSVEKAMEQEERQLEDETRAAMQEAKGLSETRRIEIRNAALSGIKDELRSAEFEAIRGVAEKGLDAALERDGGLAPEVGNSMGQLGTDPSTRTQVQVQVPAPPPLPGPQGW